jgi:hypothetical protein
MAITAERLTKILQQPGYSVDDPLPDEVKRSKYGNVPTEADGHWFASKKEARDYGVLKILQDAGQITNLRLQPRFVLQEAYTDTDGAHHRMIEYVADFQWDDLHTGKTHVRDSKGARTPVFLLKAKLFRAKYSQYVFEVI